jgi:protein-S-isoprenylcysteine O-methyltransferase Ste14
MIFRDEHNLSRGPKCLMLTVLIAAILISGFLMFANIKGNSWWAHYQIRGDLIRRIILLSCSIIYLLRLFFTMFVFLKRKVPWLEEAIPISILIALVLFAFAYVGGKNDKSINIIDIIGIFLYLCGSFLNTYSEYERNTWKKKPENKGLLYTGGLFKYSMHINYFGDVILFTGFAMITQTIYMFLIPFFMTLNFIFFLIPALDAYLKKKYGREFIEYSKRSKKFIPFIY